MVLVEGELVLFVERGGRTILTFTDDGGTLRLAALSLAQKVTSRAVDKLVVEKVDGETIHGNDFAPVLVEAGFAATPRGFRLRS